MLDLLELLPEFSHYISYSKRKSKQLAQPDEALLSALDTVGSPSATVLVDKTQFNLLPGNQFDLLATYGPGHVIQEDDEGSRALPTDGGKVALIPGKRYVVEKIVKEKSEVVAAAPAKPLPNPAPVVMFLTAAELEQNLTNNGAARPKQPLLKQIVLGFMAALFTVFSGTLALTASGSFPAQFRADYPAVTKLLMAVCFPINLILIVMMGGDLFTGNCMFMPLAYFHKKASLRNVLQIWFTSWMTNFWGCLFFGYILIYLTHFFEKDPLHTYVKTVAEGKIANSFEATFGRAIGANACVCLSIALANCGRDLWSRMIGAWLCVFTFVVIGFEHVVANMYYITIGMLYSADVNVGELIVWNMIPATIGNIIGGGAVACALFFVYGYDPKPEVGTWWWKIWTWGNENGPVLLAEYAKKAEEAQKKLQQTPTGEVALEMAEMNRRDNETFLSQADQQRYRTLLEDTLKRKQQEGFIQFTRQYATKNRGVISVSISACLVTEAGKATRLVAFAQQQKAKPKGEQCNSCDPEQKCPEHQEPQQDLSQKHGFFVVKAFSGSYLHADSAYCDIVGYSQHDLLQRLVVEDELTSGEEGNSRDLAVENYVKSVLKKWRPDRF